MPTKLSNRDIEQLLERALRLAHPATIPGGEAPYLWVREFYGQAKGQVVYRLGENLLRRDYEVGEGDAVTFGQPEAVKPVTTYEPIQLSAEFSAAPKGSAPKGYVRYEGPIFEAGTYEDKGAMVTPADLKLIAQQFTPVKANMQHVESPLDGHLGELVEVTAQGSKLRGVMHVPQWLHDLFVASSPDGKGRCPVSVELDTGMKRLGGIAYVRVPRITSAMVQAAFAAQHDVPAEPGEEDKAPRGGQTTMDKFRQTLRALFGGKEPSDADLERVRVTLDDAPAQPQVEAKQATTQPEPQTQQPANFSAEAQLASMANALLLREGEQFASRFSEQTTPAERVELAKLFGHLVRADGGGTVKFSATGQVLTGEGVKALEALFAARPKLGLTTEQIASGLADAKFGVLPDGSAAPNPIPAEMRQALGLPKETK